MVTIWRKSRKKNFWRAISVAKSRETIADRLVLKGCMRVKICRRERISEMESDSKEENGPDLGHKF
jgi:hypothetical protein